MNAALRSRLARATLTHKVHNAVSNWFCHLSLLTSAATALTGCRIRPAGAHVVKQILLGVTGVGAEMGDCEMPQPPFARPPAREIPFLQGAKRGQSQLLCSFRFARGPQGGKQGRRTPMVVKSIDRPLYVRCHLVIPSEILSPQRTAASVM